MSAKAVSLGVLVLGLGIIGSSLPALSQSEDKITSPSGWVPKEVSYIKASNTTHDFQFGYSIAVSGDGNTLAVGSINESGGSKGVNGSQANQTIRDSGAAYVFTRRNGAWVQQAYIKASNPKEEALFGNAIALSNDGNTLAVGAYLENSKASGVNGNQADTSLDSSGAVYVFTRAGANWSQQAYVKASNPSEGDQFGFSVGLSGDGNTLAVGAIEEASKATGVNGDQMDRSAPGSGAVYVFGRTGSTWSQQAYTKPDETNGLYGYSVGLSNDGNTLAAGDEGAGPGYVYVFTRQGSTWAKQGVLMAVNGERGDNFGWCLSVSGDGNTIAIGANDEDSVLTGTPPPDQGAHDANRDTSAGAAYVFVRDASGKWSQQVWLKAINARKNDQFADSISISRDGNTVAVGSIFGAGSGGSKGVNADPNDDSLSGSGSAYIYTRTGATWKPAAYVKATNARVGAQFANSVALSGDGKTLAVGSAKETSNAKGVNGNQADTSAPEAGAVYIYY
jgi:FG-GAP repeat